MKIDVSRLKENKVENLQELVSAADLDLNTEELRYRGSINISTQARKEMQLLYTDTHLSAVVEFRCSRCLKQCVQPIERDFDINYPVDKNEQFIDITRDIREEVILGYPVKFLCKTDCRGICQKCGKDLNEGDCGCAG